MPNLKEVKEYWDAGRVIGALLDMAKEYADKDECAEKTVKQCVRMLKDTVPVRCDEATDIDRAMEWLNGYAFADTKEIYTNGTVLVPLFRVKQALVDKAYNGLLEG